MSLSDRWAVALGVAFAVAVVVQPLAGRRTGGSGRRRRRAARPVGLAAGAATSLVFLAGGSSALVVGVVAALLLVAAGMLLDRQMLPERLGRVVLLAACAAVVAAGLRLPAAGFEGGDVVLTFAFLAAAASAWRSSRARDGQLLGSAIIIAAAAGMLGAFAGQDALAATAATLLGSSVAVLGWWALSGSVRLGRSGSMLLGFLTAVVALDAQPALGTPRDAAIPVILLALPLVDTLLVGISAARGRGLQPIDTGITGRLRALGLSPHLSSVVILTLQLALGAIALLAGRGVVAIGDACIAAAVVVAIVLLPCALARLEAPTRWSRRVVLVAAAVVFVLLALSVPAGIALLRARDAATAAANAAQAGLAAARQGDSVAAAAAFAVAEDQFAEAGRQLTNPFVSGGLVLPVIGPNLDAARELSEVGLGLARTGRSLATTADPQQLEIRDGTVNLAELRRLEPELAAAAEALTQASEKLVEVDRAFLVSNVDDAIRTLERRLTKAIHDTRIAADAARVLPAVFGGDGPKRYFLAVQNNAESRATGGFFGSYGIVTAENGRLDLDDFERITALQVPPNTPNPPQRVLRAPPDYIARYQKFQPQVTFGPNFSPDLPTVGAVVADLLPQAGGGQIDGIIVVDPIGLASVLELTGPISVPPWPVAITADNIADIALRDAYAFFGEDPTRARDDFLADVAQTTWDAFTSVDLGNPSRVIRALGRATHEKHLSVWLADPGAEQLLIDADADGSVPPPGTDFSMVTTQNAAANKLDVYLNRTIRYRVQLTPDESTGRADVHGELSLTLENGAPNSGLVKEVLGPNLPELAPGDNTSFVSIYSPFGLSRATVDGAPLELETQRELDYWVGSTLLPLGPGVTRTIEVTMDGSLRLVDDDRYVLRLGRQPLEAPDDVDVVVSVPEGWRIRPEKDLDISANGREARFSRDLERDTKIVVEVEREEGNSIWAQLEEGPRD